VLGTVQRAIEEQERLLQLTTELKKSLLHKLFTEGLRSKSQKMTEIGLVPESWEVTTLGTIARFQTGGTPSREVAEYWRDGDISWVKTTEIDYRVIKATEEKITQEGLKKSAAKIFPSGTLLAAMYGQGVTRGRVGILGINAATNQASASITPHDEDRVSTRFIYYFLQYHYENLRQMGHGANQKNMNMALLRSFQIAYPNPDDQAIMVNAFQHADGKLSLIESRQRKLTDLFRTLLHQLMTTQTRVHDLDLSRLKTRLTKD
jgi:type I restriction enzyme S subunit